MILNIERKNRIIVGILALIAVLMFLATTFGSSAGVLSGEIAIGIFISLMLFTESGIVRYISQSGFKKFTFGDIVVLLGTLAGASLFVFSVSLIPQVGEVLPVSVTNFTTSFARIIAGISAVILLIFVVTPRFE